MLRFSPDPDEFDRLFPDEETCVEAVLKLKWRQGFRCDACGHDAAYRICTRALPLFECARCGHQSSLTSGTFLHKSRTPLRKWLLAMFCVARQEASINAVALSKLLQVTYKTAFGMLRKIRQCIASIDRDVLLEGRVQGKHILFMPDLMFREEGESKVRSAVVARSVSEASGASYYKLKLLSRSSKLARKPLTEAECVAFEQVHCQNITNQARVQDRLGQRNGGQDWVQDRLGQHNGGQDGVQNRLGQHNGGQDGVQNRLGQRNGGQDGVQNRLSQNSADQDKNQERLSPNIVGQNRVQERLSQHEARRNRVRSRGSRPRAGRSGVHEEFVSSAQWDPRYQAKWNHAYGWKAILPAVDEQDPERVSIGLAMVARTAFQWMNDTFHGVGAKYASLYFDEFCFRLNGRVSGVGAASLWETLLSNMTSVRRCRQVHGAVQ